MLLNCYDSVIDFANEVLLRKDPYNHHGAHVSEISLEIANESGQKFSGSQLEHLRLGASIHDVGKILLDDVLLNYPRALTAGEYARMQNHVTLGYNLLASLNYADEIVDIIRCHHEHYDGSGYPNRLVGEHIPRGARIVCIADTWESMTHDRAYRKALTFDNAMVEMNRCAGWFDPKFYAAFLRVIKG